MGMMMKLLYLHLCLNFCRKRSRHQGNGMIKITFKWRSLKSLSKRYQDTIRNELHLDAEEKRIGTEATGSMFVTLLDRHYDPLLLLARDGKKIIGWCACFHEHGKWKWMYMFYVHETYRRRGIATMLAKKAQSLGLLREIKGDSWDIISQEFFSVINKKIAA